MTPDDREIRNTMERWKRVQMPNDADVRIRSALANALGEHNEGLSGNSKRYTPRTWRRAFTWSSAMAAVIVIAVAFTPVSAYAVFQKVFQYIPGFGTLRESPAGSTDVLVLKKPKRVNYDGTTITVSGIMATSHSLWVKVQGPNSIPYIKTFRFINSKGKSYNLKAGSTGIGGNWISQYEYNGDVQNAQTGTLVIGENPIVKVPVALTKPEAAQHLSGLGPTDTHNGVTIAAVPSVMNQHVQISFVSKHAQNYRVSDYVSEYNTSKRELIVIDAKGKRIGVKQLSGFMPASFTFTPTPGGTRYKVTIPAITARYNQSVKVTLPVPRNGSLTVKKQVSIAGLPVVFTKVQWVKEKGKSELQFIAHRLGQGNVSRTLEMFTIEGTSSAHANPKAGTFTLQEPVAHWRRYVTLHLTNIDVQINGPWKFDVTVPQK